MQINSITPVSFQTNRGSSKTTAPSFGQAELSDTEKLAKALEALGNIGSALTKIGADAQAAVASLKDDNAQLKTENRPADNTQNLTGKEAIKAKIISKTPEINDLIHYVKQEYKIGARIINNSDEIMKESDEDSNVCVKEISQDGFNITYDKEAEEKEGLHYKTEIGNYTVFNSLGNVAFEMTKELPGGIKESFTYNDGNNFYYKKFNPSTKETLAYLNLDGNYLKYYDKNNEPEGLTLQINKEMNTVTYFKGNNYVYQESDKERRVNVDSKTINLLLGRI